MTGLDQFYDKLEDHFANLEESVTKKFKISMQYISEFSPLQDEVQTREWAEYLTMMILSMLHDPQSNFSEEAKASLNQQLLKIPPHIKPSLDIEHHKTPPSSPARPSVSSPDLVDLSHEPSTPVTKNPSSIPTIPPLADSPVTESKCSALVPLQQQSDTYMSASTTTTKRQASSPPRLYLKNMKSKISKVHPDITNYFQRQSDDDSTKSANSGADLAN